MVRNCTSVHAGYKVRDGSEQVTARKVVQLYALPRILVLHLKRFAYTFHTGTGKIHKTVHYGDRLRYVPLPPSPCFTVLSAKQW